MHAFSRPGELSRPTRPLALAPSEPQWRPGLFVGGPADGEQGPLDGDRVTLVRRGRVHRYSVMTYEGVDGRTIKTWIYAGPAPRVG